VAPVDAQLIALAEEPGLWIPEDPLSEEISGDGYTIVTWARRASIERIRLSNERVEAAIDEVRAHARALGVDEATWWVGELTTPGDLAETLEARGLAPDPDFPGLTSLVLTTAPAGTPQADVVRIETFEDFLRGIELDWEVWNLPAEVRDERRAAAREHWDLLVADGTATHYVALQGGKPGGFGRMVMTPFGGLMLGGAVLPEARGRGLYTALVHARWQDAVAKGIPRLVVSAGPMSAPILERLGFERIGSVRLLRDRL
jgi:GNAT superfamily N-acetyltransferase